MLNAALVAVLSIGIGTTVTATNGLAEGGLSGFSAVEDSPLYPIVRQNAVYHPEAFVRVAAWHAIWSDEWETALPEYIATGYNEARQRASQNHARNRDFIQRVVNTYSPRYSPKVHSEAQRALRGTDADRDQFVRTGFAAAKAMDEAAREADEERKQQILQADRDFVSSLAVKDPGEHVRLAAQHAMRAGGMDVDLRAFYASEWMAAAAVDLDVFRLRSQEAGIRYHAVIPRLIADAQDAEREALAASGAAAEQARAVAARAWATTKEKAEAARQTWEDEAAACAEQARYWRTIIERAKANIGPEWAAIATTADKNRGSWATEGNFADGQSTHFGEVQQQAQDGYDRMTNPV
ncbi:hypothetical protein LWC34_46625 [Kibdelosporangium philippinense]|uniref:Uncharacterized protein n=1 Tax=Kibdelosporangium philippinense TaxID=211113 RepID=A0ABS8ZR62_9PSEU|nr:hypothetical protein [Kibdelosporangium philippinense]MCE7010231.1 hypothetical protein [Kibdelosporangium philippinense]